MYAQRDTAKIEIKWLGAMTLLINVTPICLDS